MAMPASIIADESSRPAMFRTRALFIGMVAEILGRAAECRVDRAQIVNRTPRAALLTRAVGSPTMKALAHRGTPAAPDARPNARAASQSRLLRELLRGDGADHAKALLLFDGMVAAADVTLESVHLVLQACADEKAATSILASAAEANATPTAATWRLLRRPSRAASCGACPSARRWGSAAGRR